MRKLIFFSVSIFLLMLPAIFVNAQCTQKLEVKKIKFPGYGTESMLELKVQSEKNYKCELLEIKEMETKSVQIFSGSGNKTFSFDQLHQNCYYKIIVEFDGEEKFLCKRKVITNINFTDK